MLAPNDIFEPRTPFNLVAALDAAYHAAVLPRRCYAAAARRVRRLTGIDRSPSLHVVDEDGNSVYGPAEQDRSIEQERAFWRMFDLVLDRLDLRGAVANVHVIGQEPSELSLTLAVESARPVRRLAVIAADREEGE